MSPSLPRVTEILEAVGLGPDYSKISRAVLDHAAARGRALHMAIQWDSEGSLDESSLHDQVRPGFEAYRRFVKETNHQPIASEIELVHPLWHYVGHPDRIGWHQGTERVLLDWKYVASLDEDAARLQLAAYRMAWNALYPTEPISRCFALRMVRATGGYRMHDLTDPNAEQDFLAGLVVYRNLERRGRLRRAA